MSSRDIAIRTSNLGKAYRLGVLSEQKHSGYDILGFNLPLQRTSHVYGVKMRHLNKWQNNQNKPGDVRHARQLDRPLGSADQTE